VVRLPELPASRVVEPLPEELALRAAVHDFYRQRRVAGSLALTDVDSITTSNMAARAEELLEELRLRRQHPRHDDVKTPEGGHS
jgi:hypothetical protein